MCRAVKVLGKRGTSGELPHALLEVSSVIGVAHELGTTSSNRLHGWGMGEGWGWGLEQAVARQSSHCAGTLVLLMPHKLLGGRNSQVNWTLSETPLQLWLSS